MLEQSAAVNTKCPEAKLLFENWNQAIILLLKTDSF